MAVSDSGLVAGNDNSFANEAFFWQGGTRTFLGPPPGLHYPHAEGLNDQGKVVGRVYDPTIQIVNENFLPPQYYDTILGFVWDAVEAGAERNPWAILATPGHSANHNPYPTSSAAFAINNAGVVTGQFDGTAAKWVNGAISILGWPSPDSVGFAINASGSIAGRFGGTYQQGYAYYGILDGQNLGVGTVWDINDNGDLFRDDGLTLASGQPYSQMAGNSGQVNNAGEVVDSWGGHFWKKHPKARQYDSFVMTELVNSGAFEAMGLSAQQGIYPTAINNNGAITGFGYDADGYSKAFLLLPAELMVDGNRDGEMSFTDATLHDKDGTSEENPYRFWVNDDQDNVAIGTVPTSYSDGETVPANNPNYNDPNIRTARDLEDWSRLWISFKGLTDLIKAGDVTVELQFVATEGQPSIRVCQAVEADGGTKYITEGETAVLQISGDTDVVYGLISASAALDLKDDAHSDWIDSLSESNSTLHLLFEGAGEGKGKLQLKIKKGGQVIGQYPDLYLDIKNVRKMYERSDISGNNQWSAVRFEKAPDEEKQALVFVHGWRLSPEGASNFAESMFKRVWWQGFKGRFAAVRWNTYWTDAFEDFPGIGQALDAYLSRYDDSEHNAWYAGQGLKSVVAGLPVDYQKSVVAHSMGNVVTGAALLSGLQVSDYALLNAAVPAGCYDENTQLQQVPTTRTYAIGNVPLWDTRTPDDDEGSITRGLAYRSRLRTVNGHLINFHLDNDRGTVYAWELNNALKPDNGFFYSRNEVDGSRIWKNEAGIRRALTDPYEAMPYADQAWSKCAGADGRTGGAIADNVDLNASFAFQDEHSAEFNLSIQRLHPFYHELLRQLSLSQNP